MSMHTHLYEVVEKFQFNSMIVRTFRTAFAHSKGLEVILGLRFESGLG